MQRALSLLSTHSLPCSDGHTPLENAVMNGHGAVVAYLRRIGSPPLSFRLRVCVCLGACFQ
jgi:ankyrin repeat protein